MVKQRNSKTAAVNLCQYKAGVFHVQSTLVKQVESEITYLTKLVFRLLACWRNTHFRRLLARMVVGVKMTAAILPTLPRHIENRLTVSSDLEFLKWFLENEKNLPLYKGVK